MQKFKVICQKIKSSNPYIILNRIITLRGCNIFAPSSLAFFIILSLFPCLVLIEILLSLANLSLDQSLSIFSLIFSIDDEVSVSIKEFINNMLVNNIFTFLFSGIIIIYLSSKGIGFFRYQVRQMYKKNIEKEVFIKRKVKDIAITLLLLATLSFSLTFLVIFDGLIQIKNQFILGLINYIYLLIILFIFIEILYVISTSKEEKFKEVFWGCLFSTIGIGVGIILYYFYLTKISSSLNYYGPLDLIALLFLICYYSSYIMFFGVEINIIIKEKYIIKLKRK